MFLQFAGPDFNAFVDLSDPPSKGSDLIDLETSVMFSPFASLLRCSFATRRLLVAPLALVLLCFGAAGAQAQTGQVSGCAWHDLDYSGQRDGGETTGVPLGGNLSVSLYQGNSQVQSQSLSAGCYSFTNLAAGTYRVRTALKSGNYFEQARGARYVTQTDVGPDATDNDFSPRQLSGNQSTQMETGDLVLAVGNEVLTNVDLGYYISPIIGDKVFYDIDGDGEQDAGEPGVPGVRIDVRQVSDNALYYSTTSRWDGTWKIWDFKDSENGRTADMRPGDFYFEFTLPNGHVFTAQDAVADGVDSDPDAAGRTNNYSLNSDATFVPLGYENDTIDAGMFRSCSVTAGTVAGVVFQDYNGNGSYDPGETTLAGTRVTAYDASNAQVDFDDTLADGTYTLSVPSGTDVRLEFTNLAGGSLSGPVGLHSESTVQFLTSPSCNADLAINRAYEFCQGDPRTVTTCFVKATASSQNLDAIVDVPWNIGDTDFSFSTGAAKHGHPASAAQVGPVYGLAWHSASGTLYSGAMAKAQTLLGPGGPGAIYEIDAAGNVSTFVDLEAEFSDPPDSITNYSGPLAPGANIPDLYAGLFKESLGDIELSWDQQTLWAVNLETANRDLVEIQLVPGATPTSKPTLGTVSRHPIDLSLITCPSFDDVRPWGLGVNPLDDLVYIAVMCTGESTNSNADLRGAVFSWDGTSFNNVIEFPINWASWGRWRANFTSKQPQIVDVVFHNGDMILPMRDKAGDMNGNANSPKPGDVVRACPTGPGSWTLESNGGCGGLVGLGAGNGDGPGGGEFYSADSDWVHLNEHVTGGAATWPGHHEFPMAGEDNNKIVANGLRWHSTDIGGFMRDYTLYQSSSNFFGKSTGLGDVELMCSPAPIEIGNRVWEDTNNNGRQDPGESPIAGVVVNLLDAAGTVLATATTNAQGEYRFVSASSPAAGSGASHIGDLAGDIAYATDYVVQIAPSNFTGGVLVGYTPATVDYDANNNNTDAHDSDGALVTIGASTFLGHELTTGGVGNNDHRYDFGFVTAGTGDLMVTKTVTGATAGYTGGNFTIEVDCDDGTTHDVTQNIANGGSFTITGIPVGTTCTISESAVPTPAGGYVWQTPVFTPSSSVTIVTAGATLNATVSNPLLAPGSIRVTKTVDGPDAPNPWQFTLGSTTTGCSIAHVTPNPASTANGSGGVVDFNDLPVTNASGTTCEYTITETAQANYSIDTANTTPFPLTGITVSANTVTPVAIENDAQPGSVTVTKTTDPAGSAQAFSFTLTPDPNGANPQAITDGQMATWNNLPAGTYTLAETSVAGWTQGALTCGATADTDGNLTDASVTFNLAVAASVSCSITNIQDRYDLALTKVYTSDDYNTTNDGVVARGALVTYTVTVINQGNQPAANVVVTDTMPAGFSFPAAHATNTANGWSLVAGNPTTTINAIAPSGQAGDTVTRQIVLEVGPTVAAGASVNYAEISSDDGNDVDSTTDTNSTNDAGGTPGSAADDATGGDGTGAMPDTDAATDEDDHDPAQVTVETYDLALIKEYTSDNYDGPADGIVTPGALVTYTITVTNQGTVPASNVEVVDYLGAGLVFPAGNATNTANGWSLVAGIPTTVIAALAPTGQAGDSVSRQIVLQVSGSAALGNLDNYAEISVDDGDDIDSIPNTTNNDPGGAPGSPADNATGGDGTGVVGDGRGRH